MNPQLSSHGIARLLPGIATAFCLLGIVSLAQGVVPAPATPSASASAPAPAKVVDASSLTKAVPRSSFTEIDLFTERDPLAPVGYLKPKPLPPGVTAVAEAAKPLVEIRLVISGISSIGNTRAATLEDGSLLEENGSFKFSDGKNTVTYKVLRISDGGVTILYEDKEMEFKMKGSDLEIFKEKE